MFGVRWSEAQFHHRRNECCKRSRFFRVVCEIREARRKKIRNQAGLFRRALGYPRGSIGGISFRKSLFFGVQSSLVSKQHSTGLCAAVCEWEFRVGLWLSSECREVFANGIKQSWEMFWNYAIITRGNTSIEDNAISSSTRDASKASAIVSTVPTVSVYRPEGWNLPFSQFDQVRNKTKRCLQRREFLLLYDSTRDGSFFKFIMCSPYPSEGLSIGLFHQKIVFFQTPSLKIHWNEGSTLIWRWELFKLQIQLIVSPSWFNILRITTQVQLVWTFR